MFRQIDWQNIIKTMCTVYNIMCMELWISGTYTIFMLDDKRQGKVRG